jgi:hypothetical protein
MISKLVRYAANRQFGVMAGERLRLNIFGLLKIRSSIEVYRLKSATNAKFSMISQNDFLYIYAPGKG